MSRQTEGLVIIVDGIERDEHRWAIKKLVQLYIDKHKLNEQAHISDIVGSY
jgi:hypothetical protein